MKKEINKISKAKLLDLLSFFHIDNTANAIWDCVLEKRRSDALEILLREIRGGNFENIDNNEIVSILHRYLRDASEGTARNNLLLLAKVINGMAVRKEISAPDFLRYSKVLNDLTEEEIFCIGEHIKKCKEKGKDYTSVEPEQEITQEMLIVLVRTGLIHFYHNPETTNEFVYTGIDDGENQDIVKLNTEYQFTSLMDEILRYTDFIIKDLDKNK